MINTIIANLRDRRQSLLKKAAELDDARQLVQLNAKTGQISIEKANAETSKIAAERSIVDAVLAERESIIAELIAGLPLQLTTADSTTAQIADVLKILPMSLNSGLPLRCSMDCVGF
jgi:hypothetical protein